MIIKEYTPLGNHKEARVTLRECNYDARLSKFQALWDEAQIDFPGLKIESARIVHYAGNVQAHQWGIEFDARLDAVPEEYTRTEMLQPRY